VIFPLCRQARLFTSSRPETNRLERMPTSSKFFIKCTAKVIARQSPTLPFTEAARCALQGEKLADYDWPLRIR
jgi:hypothetical protein